MKDNIVKCLKKSWEENYRNTSIKRLAFSVSVFVI